jgi:hypothetical protein
VKKEDVLNELEEVARQIGFRVRYERGDFAGGDCKLHEEKILVINKFVPVETKIATIAKVLGTMNIQELYITPQVRKLLDDETPAKPRRKSEQPQPSE